ncbi:MAG: HEAT repeat domain-containing protein [Verrucomicrobiales bacterium]|nr:HEAT repeat domain-containing protein [Verrucomicrobiales bacterium]
MKPWFVLAVALTALAGLLSTSLEAAEVRAEQPDQPWLQVLQSPEATLQQKDAACSALKREGTARSVPALAALLRHPDLSHSARHALETMPFPEAAEALRAALARTTGLVQVGIADSLGKRGDKAAVPGLAGLLANGDTQVATAAAAALGRIGGPEAVRALQQAWAGPTQATPAVLADSLLRCGHGFLADGENAAAVDVFRTLVDGPEAGDLVRQAAFRRSVSAAGDLAPTVIAAAMREGDEVLQAAALQLTQEFRDSRMTDAMVALLPQVSGALQLGLIDNLGWRRDPAAGPALLALARQTNAPGRLAAVRGLGWVGDASAVAVLVETAADPDAELRKAARDALLVLHRGPVTQSLLAQLETGNKAVQAEAIQALAGRADTAAVPRLLELARSSPEATQTACFRALALLAGEPHLPSLARLVIEADTAATREAAQDALGTACQRVEARQHHLDVTPIVQGIAEHTHSPEARAALLAVGALLVDPQVRAVTLTAARDGEARVREAAIRSMCESRDPAFLPSLLALARDSSDVAYRALATRGYVRLVTDENASLDAKSRLARLREILAVAQRPEEQRVVLGGLAAVPDPTALALAVQLLEEPAIQAEAGRAIVQIAASLAGTPQPATEAALRKVWALTADPRLRQDIEAVFKQMHGMRGFLTDWQVAGPYGQDGKDYTALFDIAFPPETNRDEVAWKSMPTGTDPQRPWLLDLLKHLSGEQCVAYLRTHLYSEEAEPARIEFGSDDGLKVWLNGQVVHTHNTARPLTVGSDPVNVTLKPGWNTLLIKVTQNNLGWECCARLVRPDGSPLEGVRVEAGKTE